MNFIRRHDDDEPEINLVPLIDVLLVILIFLAATTSFTRFQQLKLTLPQASSSEPTDMKAIDIAISREGIYALNGQLLAGNNVQDIASALSTARHDQDETTLVINADALSTHESVVRVMEAARVAGIKRVNFATQSRH
jgi:biopolymer transport protein ExbD